MFYVSLCFLADVETLEEAVEVQKRLTDMAMEDVDVMGVAEIDVEETE